MAFVLPSPLRSSSATTLLRRRSMFRQIKLGFGPGLVVATLFAWGCDRPATPAGPKPSFSDGTASCAAGARLTGGGRIDPPGAGETALGFHLDPRDLFAGGGGGPHQGPPPTLNSPTQKPTHHPVNRD